MAYLYAHSPLQFFSPAITHPVLMPRIPHRSPQHARRQKPRRHPLRRARHNVILPPRRALMMRLPIIQPRKRHIRHLLAEKRAQRPPPVADLVLEPALRRHELAYPSEVSAQPSKPQNTYFTNLVIKGTAQGEGGGE